MINKDSFVFSIGKITITLLLSHMASLPHMWHHRTWKILTVGYQIHYSSNYRTRLLNLNMLPLMHTYDLCDILFFIKSVRHPTNHFNINNYVSFCHHPTRSSTNNKLQHNFTSSTKLSNFYLNRLPRTYNSLPVLNLDQSFHAIKAKLHKIFW